MSDDIHVRAAVDKDIPQILQIASQNGGAWQSISDVEKFKKAPKNFLWVAESGGQIVGYLGYKNSDQSKKILHMEIAKSGKSQELVIRALIEQVILSAYRLEQYGVSTSIPYSKDKEHVLATLGFMDKGTDNSNLEMRRSLKKDEFLGLPLIKQLSVIEHGLERITGQEFELYKMNEEGGLEKIKRHVVNGHELGYVEEDIQSNSENLYIVTKNPLLFANKAAQQLNPILSRLGLPTDDHAISRQVDNVDGTYLAMPIGAGNMDKLFSLRNIPEKEDVRSKFNSAVPSQYKGNKGGGRGV